MRIDPKAKVAGRSMLEIRRLFQALGGGPHRLESVANALKLSVVEAGPLVRRLARLGYLEETSERSGGQWYKATRQGRRLACATAAKPVHRRTAERALQAFLARARQVNEAPDFLYRVATVVVFGSFLTRESRLSDLDLAIRLEPKERDRSRWAALWDARIQEVQRSGRRFYNLADKLCWPQTEVLLFLRGRSRVIQLHDFTGYSCPLPKGQVYFRG